MSEASAIAPVEQSKKGKDYEDCEESSELQSLSYDSGSDDSVVVDKDASRRTKSDRFGDTKTRKDRLRNRQDKSSRREISSGIPQNLPASCETNRQTIPKKRSRGRSRISRRNSKTYLEMKQQSAPFCKSICLSIVFVLGVAASLLYMFPLAGEKQDVFSLLPLTAGARPSNRCLPIAIDTWQEKLETSEGKDLVYSLKHHLEKQGLTSITAFDLNKPLCAMMYNTVNGNYRLMLNPMIIAYQLQDYLALPESNLACPDIELYIQRSQRIIVRYIDGENFTVMDAVVKDDEALAVQQGWSRLRGLSVCDRSDDGVRSIYDSFREDKKMREIHDTKFI
jgi:peptide deformylase